MHINIKKLLLYIVNILFGLLTIAPLIYALLISFMPPDQIFLFPPRLIPKRIYLENYVQALQIAPIFTFIFNSVVVSSIVTICQIFTSCLAAFSFSFLKFKGRNMLFMIMLTTMMIPGETTLISNYLTIGSLGWLDTYKALITPFMSSAMGIFIMRQYYLTLPKELHEAAMLDGSGNFGFFIKIVLPLSKPVAGSLGVYSFLITWNQYLWPLLVTSKETSRTVQIGISMLQFSENQSFGIIMAGIVMVLLPSIIIFIIFQKQLIEGVTSGAVKG